jgi:hypothetical protein
MQRWHIVDVLLKDDDRDVGNRWSIIHLEWRTYALGGFGSSLPARADRRIG